MTDDIETVALLAALVVSLLANAGAMFDVVPEIAGWVVVVATMIWVASWVARGKADRAFHGGVNNDGS